MQDKILKEIILSDPLISKVFGDDAEVYLVGGYLRDILRGIRSKDMDFVVIGDARELVRKIFSQTGVSIVEFRKADLIRVVIGDMTLDFSDFKGRIEDDLSRRDFTMNAIAWSGREGLIDPLNGVADIEKRSIGAIAEKNFIDDPLRLLRAYRFAGELGWKIKAGTRGIIKKLKDLIRLSASERITLEFFKLMDSQNHLKALKLVFKDGLLQEILSYSNSYLSYNIEALSRLESFIKNLPEGQCIVFNKPFSQGLSYLGLIRMEQLLYGSDLDKDKLMLSNAILKRVEATTRLLRDYSENKNVDRSRMFDMLSKAGDAFVDFAILTRRRRFVREAVRFSGMKPVITAEEIIKITHASGPKIGELINEMKKLQFLGKIKTKKDARAWLAASKK